MVGPVLVDLALSGNRRPFGYAAADTFYYLVVARNIARHGSFSFDGHHATNGFHPLWQLLTGALAFVTEHLGGGSSTLDPAGLAAARAGKLYEVAYQRGFKCVTSLVYASAQALFSDPSSIEARRYAQERFGSVDLSAFDFRSEFVTPSGSLALVCGRKIR